MQVAQITTAVAFLAATLGGLTFCVLYHRRTFWWASVWGKHMMAFSATATALLLQAVLRTVFGETWWITAMRLVLTVIVAFLLWQRVALLLRAQRTSGDDTIPMRHAAGE